MFSIEYKQGDLFKDVHLNTCIIHVVNNCMPRGVWGAGFVVPLGKMFPLARTEYLEWAKTGFSPLRVKHYHDDEPIDEIPYQLGQTQFVKVNYSKVWAGNMLAQSDVGRNEFGQIPLRYECLEECLYRVRKFAEEEKVAVIGPKFGSGLSGGSWVKIEEIINKVFKNTSISFTIYEYVG